MGIGGLGEKEKELRSRNWQLENRHWNVKYKLGNTGNNIEITMYGARGIIDLWGI